MASIIYNTVEIPYLLTRGYLAKVETTEDKADYRHTLHEVTAQGVIWATESRLVADWFREIRHLLEQPRKSLLYTVNGATIVQSNADLDLINGPWPEVVGIDKVQGSESLLITFKVRTALWGCDGRLPTWISNRWEETQSIDADQLSKLTRTGKLIFAKDRRDTEAARGIVTPPIAPGFSRVGAEYKLQSDGLALAYTFTDKEVEYQPPAPAIRIDDATYTETSPNGALRYGEVRIALTGQPRGNRQGLLATAILMAVRRMQAAGAMRPGVPSPPIVMSLMEKLHRNFVQVRIQTMLPTSIKVSTIGPSDTYNKVARLGDEVIALGRALAAPKPAAEAPIPRLVADLKGWGFPPHGTDPLRIPDPGLRGPNPTPLVLIAAALNDPCLVTALTQPRTQTQQATLPTPVIEVVPFIAAEIDPSIDASLAPAGLYTDCRILSRWDEDKHIAQLASTDTEGKSSFVGYASPTKQLVVNYTVERVGGQPTVPPENLGSNYVLLAVTQPIPELSLASDGQTPIIRASGTRIYGVVDPTKVIQGAAIPPWILDQLLAMQLTGDAQNAATISEILAVASGIASGVEEPGVFPWISASQSQNPTPPAIG